MEIPLFTTDSKELQIQPELSRMNRVPENSYTTFFKNPYILPARILPPEISFY